METLRSNLFKSHIANDEEKVVDLQIAILLVYGPSKFTVF